MMIQMVIIILAMTMLVRVVNHHWLGADDEAVLS